MKNYIKTALRFWFRRPVELVINLAGLTLGVAVALMIFLFVQHEKSFDSFHAHSKHIYRLCRGNSEHQNLLRIAGVYYEDFAQLPGFREMVRLNPREQAVKYKEEIRNEMVCYVDTGFFGVFDFPVIQGSREHLGQPYSLYITESTAGRYFSDSDPLGEQLYIDNEWMGTVRGIVADPPSNSHLHFDVLASMESLKKVRPWNFTNPGVMSFIYYFRLQPGVSPDGLSVSLQEKMAELTGGERKAYYRLQPLEDIRLHSSELEGDFAVSRDPRVMGIIQLIGILILLIAVVNYVNLSQSVVLTRLRESEIRRVNGAHTRHLIGQHLLETFLICAFCTFLGFVIADLTGPFFDQRFDAHIALPGMAISVMTGLGIALLLSLISGFYPAALYAQNNRSCAGSSAPLPSMKASSLEGFRSRDLLIGIQFFITAGLVTGFLSLNNQFKYLTQEDLGYNRDQVIVLENPFSQGGMVERYERIREDMEKVPGVLAISAGHNVPGGRMNNMSGIRLPGQKENVLSYVVSVEKDYFDLLDMKMVQGSGTLREWPNDSISGVIINEQLRDRLGLKSIEGVRIRGAFNTPLAPVIGVVRNAHYKSKEQEVEPLVYQTMKHDYPSYVFNMLFKVHPEAVPDVLAKLEESFNTHAPDFLFQYTFLDDQTEAMYTDDRQLITFVNLFTILALIISAMGLLGISMHTFNLSRKKLAIHKVQGAGTLAVVHLLSSKYLRISLAACLLTIPLVHWLMAGWLEGFTYRIDYPWLSHVWAALFLLGLTLLALGYVLDKSLKQNPAEVLRTE